MEAQHYKDGGMGDNLVCYGDVWIEGDEDDNAVFGEPSGADQRNGKHVDNTEFLRGGIKASGRMIFVREPGKTSGNSEEARDTIYFVQPGATQDLGLPTPYFHPRTRTRIVINMPGWLMKQFEAVIEFLKVARDVVLGESDAWSRRSTLINNRSP